MSENYEALKTIYESELTEAQQKAFAYYVKDPVQWWLDALNGKAANRMKAVVAENSKYDPSKLTDAEMEEIVNGLELTAKADQEDLI